MKEDSVVSVPAVWAAAGLAIYLVLALWGFWQDGPWALGMNATLYFGALFALFAWQLQSRRGVNWRSQLYWLVPLGLIAASYSFYDNPFLKAVNFLVIPASLVVFVNTAGRGKDEPWGSGMLSRLVGRIFSVLLFVRLAGESLSRGLAPKVKESSLVRRVVTGTVVFLMLALFVVVPLLSSADPTFASSLKGVTGWVTDLLSASGVVRALTAFVMTVFTLSALLAWTRPLPSPVDDERKPHDDVVIGIVLGGLLGLYLLFLGIQAQRILIGSLPVDFNETVSLVKSGFWQLLALTFLNILIHFSVYRRTGRVVQKLLLAFSAASLLLLLSAGQRMALYVTVYGFSYEKFFASYTVVYCAVLLGWLLYFMIAKRSLDVVKLPLVLFIWMYAVLTVMPVERIILGTNLALVQRADSRINLLELSMLSSDVIGPVEAEYASGILTDMTDRNRLDLGGQSEAEAVAVRRDVWSNWLKSRREQVYGKSWHELNLGNIVYLVGSRNLNLHD